MLLWYHPRFFGIEKIIIIIIIMVHNFSRIGLKRSVYSEACLYWSPW